MEHVLPPPPPSRPYLATPPPNRPILRTPDDQRQVQSAPPERSLDEEDPLMGKHSKLYQRRKEIEGELRRQFSLPEEAVEVLQQLRSRRSSSYGCPPPVPKLRSGKSKLPPIPKPVEIGGQATEADLRQDGPPPPAVGEAPRAEPWWKLEQENLARRNQEREAHEAFVKSASKSRPEAESSVPQVHALERSIHLRPQSWRMGRPPPERNASEFHPPRVSPFGREGPSEEPWRAKARELEALASAHRLKREEARAPRLPESQEEEALPAQVRYSQDYLKELRQREEQRFEEMKKEELRKLQKEREEARKRREEQEDWEKAMRQQFAEEAARLKAAQQRQQEAEDEQQKYWQQEAERQKAEREGRRRREAEREERHRARQAARAAQAQQARHETPEPPKGFRPEAPGFRSDAEHRSSSQPSFSPSSSRPPPPAGRGFNESSAKKRVRSEQVFREPVVSAGELQAAKSAAMRQLLCLKQNPSREARQKGFKELLRVWHPDKNPESCEVATAVFQMIQAERSRILPK